MSALLTLVCELTSMRAIDTNPENVPLGLMVRGWPFLSRATREHVASKPNPFILSGDTLSVTS